MFIVKIFITETIFFVQCVHNDIGYSLCIFLVSIWSDDFPYIFLSIFLWYLNGLLLFWLSWILLYFLLLFSLSIRNFFHTPTFVFDLQKYAFTS